MTTVPIYPEYILKFEPEGSVVGSPAYTARTIFNGREAFVNVPVSSSIAEDPAIVEDARVLVAHAFEDLLGTRP